MASDAKQTKAEQAAKDAAVSAASKAWRRRPKDLDADARDALWEAMWEAYDFSWDGLADAGWKRGDDANEGQELKRWRAPADFPGKGPVHGDGLAAWKEATLQDYWRWSLGLEDIFPGETLPSDEALRAADLLHEDSAGILWHRLHLRRAVLNENPHALVTVQLSARLAAAADDLENGADTRLRLNGARIPGLMEMLRPAIAEDTAHTPIRLTAIAAAFDHLDLSSASFMGKASFDRTRFAGSASFDHANFTGTASFDQAIFTGMASFDHASFTGTASFDHTSFTGMASFDHANFTGTAWFSGASFADTAAFESASFAAATFEDTSFADMAWFEGASFASTAIFNDANFADEVTFNCASFTNTVTFEDASFVDMAWFDSVSFAGTATFNGANFAGSATFEDTSFADMATFEDVNFADSAKFTNVLFSTKYGAGPIHFQTATFKKLADFSRTRFPNQPERIQGAFKTARFLEEARFEIPQLTAFAAFDGAVFKGKLLLAAAGTEVEEQARFATVLRATDAAVRADAKTTSAEDSDKLERGANARFSALERGLRELKKAMAEEKDHGQEHRFFRFELQAKRHRPSTPLWEKAASWSYGVLSDYGNSIGRPLLALALSVLGFWMVYWIWGISLDQSFHGLEKERSALEFSIRNVMQPFGPWTATAKSTLFQLEIVKIVTCVGPPTEACSPTGPGWLLFRLLATLQSVFSLLLAFLFALALRKKFQIS